MTTQEKIEGLKQIWGRMDADERLILVQIFVRRYHLLIHRVMREADRCPFKRRESA